MPRPLRSHQRRIAGIVAAIAAGEAQGLRDILAAVTPGGGKSLLPVIAAARLIAAGVVERVCWIVPRDSLRLQAEEAFADPTWREALGHALSVRAAENAPDPCRGLTATSPPTRPSPPPLICTSPSSAATARSWWWTRSTTSPPRRMPSPPAASHRPTARPTPRPPGRAPSCRCWRWRASACSCPAR
jgi:hypothetical protein